MTKGLLAKTDIITNKKRVSSELETLYKKTAIPTRTSVGCDDGTFMFPQGMPLGHYSPTKLRLSESRGQVYLHYAERKQLKRS